MVIDEFPPEVLAHITSRLGGGCIFLWLTGSFKLQQLLGARGGITQLWLKDRSMNSTSRWPMLICRLQGLRDLRIDRGDSALKATQTVANQLKYLSSLRILELNCSDSSKIFAEATKFETLFPDLESLTLHSIGAHGCDHTFPSSLHTLITGCDVSLSSGTLFVPTVLPTGIQHLEFRNLTLRANEEGNLARLAELPIHTMAIGLENFSNLIIFPRTLTTLTLHLPALNSLDLGSLPDSLRHLTLRQHSVDLKAIFRLSGLLALTLKHGSTLMASQNVMFPLRLKKIDIECFCTSQRLILPNQLESFVCIGWTASCFETLQPSYEGEDLRLLSYDQLLDLKYSRIGLPKGLKTLSTSFSVASPPQGRLLPNGDSPPILGDDYLPQTLDSFSLSTRFDQKTPFFDWNCLPARQLRTISIHPTPAVPKDLLSFKNLSVLTLHYLMPGIAQNQHFFRNLPPTLLEVHLTFSSTMIPASWIAYFPKSLVQLEMRSFSSSGIENEMSPEDFDLLGQMTSLTRIILYYHLHHIEDYMLSWLPRHSLKFLMLWGRCPLLSSACFRYLPRFLETLDMKYLKKIRDDDTIHLPRTLRTLSLFSGTLSPSRYPLLPTTIRLIVLDPKPNDYIYRTLHDHHFFPDPRIAHNSINFSTEPTLLPERQLPRKPIQIKTNFPENPGNLNPNSAPRLERSFKLFIYAVIGFLIAFYFLK